MDPWERVDEIARGQHGAITRWQIERKAGVCGRVLTERLREHGWRRPYRGVYLLPGTADTFNQRASAALLAVGGAAALTGMAAAHVDGLVARPPATVEIALPTDRGTRRRSGLVLRRHPSDRFERLRSVDGLALVANWVMILDLARTCDDRTLERVISRLCSRRETTVARLAMESASIGSAPGADRLRRVLRCLDGELTHSGGERLLRDHVRAFGVEVWPRPYPVVHRGRTVAELDLAVPAVQYGAEVDGPHHLLPEQIAADQSRDRFLGRIGWTIDRFPLAMVERTPRSVAREIAARLRTLGWRPTSDG